MLEQNQKSAEDHSLPSASETARSGGFKQQRSSLLQEIRSVHDKLAESLGLPKEDRKVVENSVAGIPGQRKVMVNPEMYVYFEDGDAYGEAGKDDVIAEYDEETQVPDTNEFIRKGWRVKGDGSVWRLHYETLDDGTLAPAETVTNDELDLQQAHIHLREIGDKLTRA